MVVSDFEANNEFYGDVPPPLPLVSVQRLVEERMSILRGADLLGADLAGEDLAGANLAGANLTAAQADEDTSWPDGFDPIADGVIFE